MQIGDQTVRLFGIGYVCNALRRQRWCVLNFERLDLIPKTPWRTSRSNRRLYPEAFVERLEEIGSQDYVGKRLNWDYRTRFYYEWRNL